MDRNHRTTPKKPALVPLPLIHFGSNPSALILGSSGMRKTMDTEHTQSGLGLGQVRVPSTWSSGPVSISVSQAHTARPMDVLFN